MDTRNLGNTGEQIAVAFLEKNNFTIITQNFRSRVGEIDIIAKKNNRIHFIEVKWRKNNKYGLGREAVTYTKQKKIHNTALLWLQQNNLYTRVDICFDVLEITGVIPNHTIEHFIGCF